MAFPHELTHDLVEPAEGSGSRCLNNDAIEIVSRMRETRHLRMEGRDDTPAERQPEHRPLFLEHTDHREWKPVNAYLSADRIEVGEVSLGNLLADDDHRGADRVFLLVEHATPRDRQVLDQEVFRRSRLRQNLRPATREFRAAIGSGDVLHRPTRAGRECLAHRERILDRDLGTPLPRLPLLFRDVVLDVGKCAEIEGVYAEKLPGEILLDIPVHSLHDRHDRDEEHPADRDTDEGEEALQLLHSQRAKRQANGFEKWHWAPIVILRSAATKDLLRIEEILRFAQDDSMVLQTDSRGEGFAPIVRG